MLRATLKSWLPRLGRSGPGKHFVHGALEADRGAVRFAEVDVWPERVEQFEDLDFLFTSSQLDHGIASLRFDEAALLFRLVRSLGEARILELGRFKGGSTFLMGVAAAPGSVLRSYDLHVGHPPGVTGADLDAELRAALDRCRIDGVELIIADTRTAELPEGEWDLLFVDADHRYEGAKADVDRWSPLVREGGHLLMHDAVDRGGWGTAYPGVAQVAAELVSGGAFRQERGAGTIAHFTRLPAA